jgi:hypothetical protein
MKRQQLARVNHYQKSHDWRLRKMIEMIDRIKKSKEADEDVMVKHLSDITENDERVWTF